MMLLVLLLSAWVITISVRQEVTAQAERTVQSFAYTVMQNFDVSDLQNPESHAGLDEKVKLLRDNGTVYRVKIWSVNDSDEAQLIYSDLSELTGLTVPVSADLQAALDRREPVVIPVPNDVAHAAENAAGVNMLEVYYPFTDAAGAGAVAELYLITGVEDKTRTMLLHILPIIAGGFLGLTLLLVWPAFRLARATEKAQRAQRDSALAALAHARGQREALAQRLHDGVLQELAVASAALQLATNQADEQHRGSLETSIERVREQMRDLRQTLDELHPQTSGEALAGGDVLQALEDLATELIPEVVVSLETDGVKPGLRQSALFVQCGSELLRNIAHHAGASKVTLGLHRVKGMKNRTQNGAVVLTVRDDGKGFSAQDLNKTGSHGLRFLRTTLRGVGGELLTESKGGAQIQVIIPPLPSVS